MIGRTCGQYLIQEMLGEGSMGQVYKAEHVRLKQPVVIKFLRVELAADEGRRARFLREAEIAASLDSPGICSVIDFGEVPANEGLPRFYLVMRYCEGMTLKDRLAAGPLPLPKVTLFGVQIAEALQATEALHIVHRDIKPSNIIIESHEEKSGSSIPTMAQDPNATRDVPVMIEQAKLTDFGLAVVPDKSRLTLTNAQLGTPAYMSPEQVDGKVADSRADIWALGAVLYEMATGRPPFGAESLQAIMYAVKCREPVPVAELRPETPAEMVWIIAKALRKDPDKRYQYASEILRDLRLLKDKQAPGKRREMGSWVLESRGRMLTLGLGLLGLAAVLLGLAFFVWNAEPAPPSLGRPQQVTTDMAWEGEPAVSPDGSRIAFTSDAGGNCDICIVMVRGGKIMRLTSDPADDAEPSWHPDGSFIYFSSRRLGLKAIWKVGTMGGTPTLVVADAEDPAISPDGSQLAFSRQGPNGNLRIFAAPLESPGKARQLTFDNDGSFDHFDPAWSPSGDRICYATFHDLWLVSAAGGRARQLTTGGKADISPTWSPSGNFIYFSSMRENTGALWRVPVSGGKPLRLTPGSGPEIKPSLAPDGSVLAYSTGTEMTDDDVVIWSAATGKRFRLTGQEHTYHPSLRPDGGMICYVSNHWEGRRELWVQRLGSGGLLGEARRLTDQPGAAAQPRFSPDGHWLAYYRIENQKRTVWILPAAGGEVVAFTGPESENTQPAWSPAGDRISFTSDRDGPRGIFVAPVSEGRRTGPPVRVTPPGLVAENSAWSPDGSEIAFVTRRDDHYAISLVPADGSQRVRELALPVDVHFFTWDLDHAELLVSAEWDGELSVRRVDPVTASVAEMDRPFSFDKHTRFALFHASSSGNLIAYEVPNRRGDIWIMAAAEGTF